jgi:hypothetical protein
MKPRPPKDRVVGEFSMRQRAPRKRRRTSMEILQEKQDKRLKDLQDRLQEENEKKYAYEKRLDKIKGIIMNIILPAFVIITILLGGAIYFIPDKKPEQFQEKRTLSVQEAPKKGKPTITRSP